MPGAISSDALVTSSFLQIMPTNEDHVAAHQSYPRPLILMNGNDIRMIIHTYRLYQTNKYSIQEAVVKGIAAKAFSALPGQLRLAPAIWPLSTTRFPGYLVGI